MPLSADQRQLLGAFLRRHRERLRAEDLGLSGSQRRRTPGLRREEVAQACGISPTWYTWIEQGRDISVSPAALARLAAALRLNGAERAYLFELARKRDPTGKREVFGAHDDPSRALQPALDAMAAPAYLLDRLWRARVWNRPAARLFSDWLGGERPCLLDYMFLDPRSRLLVPDWEDRARRLVAEFRADSGREPEDPELRGLIDRLRGGSATFAAFWRDHAVLAREGGLRLFNHADQGLVRYAQITLHPAAWPDYKVVMLVEATEDPART